MLFYNTVPIVLFSDTKKGIQYFIFVFEHWEWVPLHFLELIFLNTGTMLPSDPLLQHKTACVLYTGIKLIRAEWGASYLRVCIAL